jgi:hypothetical protein
MSHLDVLSRICRFFVRQKGDKQVKSGHFVIGVRLPVSFVPVEVGTNKVRSTAEELEKRTKKKKQSFRKTNFLLQALSPLATVLINMSQSVAS